MKLEQAARQALEALEQWKLCCDPSEAGNWPDEDEAAITALREALAEQAQQEPVAWSDAQISRAFKNSTELHKDVTSFTAFKRAVKAIESMHGYAAPVRTKDLTDDEIYTLYSEPCSDREMVEFARAVIAADREKNK